VDLAVARPAALRLLREDELSVGDDVELRLLSLADRGVDSAVVQLGRETRGPFVIAASDRAVQDLHDHPEIVRTRLGPTGSRRLCEPW
jgi:hypothetical protein